MHDHRVHDLVGIVCALPLIQQHPVGRKQRFGMSTVIPAGDCEGLEPATAPDHLLQSICQLILATRLDVVLEHP